MLKFTRILLCLFSALLLLSACSPTEPAPVESTAAPDTTASPEPEPALTLCADGKTEFTLVRADRDNVQHYDEYVEKSAGLLRGKLEEALGAPFGIATDWLRPGDPVPSDTCEILIGKTNRPESAEAEADLPASGFLIRVTENRIAVTATDRNAFTEAFYCIIDELICDPEYRQDNTLTLPVGLEIKRETTPGALLDYAALLQKGETVLGIATTLYNQPKDGEFRAAQGVATDGKYAYLTLRTSGSVELVKIYKVDMATWTQVAESDILPLDHANSMTYDPVGRRLVVTNMLNNVISFVDPDTLTVTGTKALDYGTYAVGYHAPTNQFAFARYAGRSNVGAADADFNLAQPDTVCTQIAAPNYIGQGMDVTDTCVLLPLSPDSGAQDNIIQVYGWYGPHYGTISIASTWEIEDLFHVDGRCYAQFNHSGATICAIEFYREFK